MVTTDVIVRDAYVVAFEQIVETHKDDPIQMRASLKTLNATPEATIAQVVGAREREFGEDVTPRKVEV